VHLGTDDLITFLGQKVTVQGHTIAAEAHSARRYRRVQLFLVLLLFLLTLFYSFYKFTRTISKDVPLHVGLLIHIAFFITPPPVGTGSRVLFSLDFFVCLFVCIFVSLSARLGENGWTDLHEIFREGVE